MACARYFEKWVLYKIVNYIIAVADMHGAGAARPTFGPGSDSASLWVAGAFPLVGDEVRELASAEYIRP